MSPASTFIGRGDAVARLVELVSRAPLVTVTGPGGVGKTRLVHEAASTLATDLTEAVWFRELAPLPPDSDVEAVSSESGFASPEVAAVALAEQSAVLVLDNCEHVLDGAASFAARVLAARGDVRLVTTSREPLGVDGEQVLVLAPLELPSGDVDAEASPAVRLFLDRATASGAAVDRSPRALATVAELCRRLDGLPLAIELAAARARAVAPAELLASMDQRLDVLRRTQRRGPGRHDSMRAAIDVSIDLLDDDDRTTFARIGVFAGPFTTDLAHGVLVGDGRDRLHTLDQLARLVDRSLLVAETEGGLTRYRMLELLRERAVGALFEAGERELMQDRFVDAMVDEALIVIADALHGWSGEILARMALQFHNLLAAVEWCVGHDPGPDRAYPLLLPLFAAVHESRSIEVLEAGERVLDRWPDHRAPWRAEALAVLTTAAVVSGDPDRADELARQSLADEGASDLARVGCERALGFSARAIGDLQSAQEHFARGRAAAHAAGAVSFARELAGFEASVRDLAGDTDGALADLDVLVAEAAEAGDAVTETWARLVRSTALMRAQRWEEAEAEVAAASAAAESLNYPWWEGAHLRQLAVLTATKGSVVATREGWSASVGLWLDAIEQAAARGSVGEVALTMRAASIMATRAGESVVARELLEAAPRSTELTVLPELFPDEARTVTLETRPPGTGPGLAEALERARAVLVTNQEGPATTVDGDGAVAAAMRRDGDTWEITYAGRTVRLRHLKGLADLAILLARPATEVHCLELMGGTAMDGDLGPALDDRARREYEGRIRDLQDDIDEARAANDPARAERAEVELDTLVEQLSAAFGLSGRSRATGSAVERARTAITYRIRAAIRRLAEHHPALGRHLDAAVRTGTWCSYRPETDTVWEVGVAAAAGQATSR